MVMLKTITVSDWFIEDKNNSNFLGQAIVILVVKVIINAILMHIVMVNSSSYCNTITNGYIG